MRILENELEARFKLTKFLIATCYVEQNIVLPDTFKQEDDIFGGMPRDVCGRNGGGMVL